LLRLRNALVRERALRARRRPVPSVMRLRQEERQTSVRSEQQCDVRADI